MCLTTNSKDLDFREPATSFHSDTHTKAPADEEALGKVLIFPKTKLAFTSVSLNYLRRDKSPVANSGKHY